MNILNKKIKLMVVDDSVTMQKFIQQLVVNDDQIEIVALANNPFEARDLIKQTNPDVLLLDIEMPRMDGLTFLENLMRLRPMPVIMNSSLSQNGAYETIRALEIGAVDYIGKPQSAELVAQYKEELVKKVKYAALVDVNKDKTVEAPVVPIISEGFSPNIPVSKIIAIGSSTGGIEALTNVLKQIPSNCPPILVVQHIPPSFSTAFANRLNELCSIKVTEAKNGDRIANGTCYIAPGGQQMVLVRMGGELAIHIHDGEPVSGHKPSVNALFHSIAQLNKLRCSAAILTGMGDDGATGLELLYKHGYPTVVQDRKTSVVWGMPQSALQLQPNHEVKPINEIARFLMTAR